MLYRRFTLAAGHHLLNVLLLALAFAWQSTASAAIKGTLEGLHLGEDDEYVLRGWTCEEGNPESLQVVAFVNSSPTPSPTGTQVDLGEADFIIEEKVPIFSQAQGREVETPVATICQTTARAYRFEYPVPAAAVAFYKGLYVHVYAVSPTTQAVLRNSGRVKVPQPLSQTDGRRGCMKTNAIVEGGSRGAYPTRFGQAQGSTWTYVAWVWREPNPSASNSTLSVAKTQNFVNWYNTCDEPLATPFNTVVTEAVLDAVLTFFDLHNYVHLDFDLYAQPIVTYQKVKKTYSRTAPPVIATQVFNARLESGTWHLYQMTQWTVHHGLSIDVHGSLPSSNQSIDFSGVIRHGNQLYQRFHPSVDELNGGNPTPGIGLWQLSSQLVVGNVVPGTTGANYGFTPESIIPDPFLKTPAVPPTAVPIPELRPPQFEGKFRTYTTPNTFDEGWPLLTMQAGSSTYSLLFNRYLSSFLGFDNGAYIGQLAVGSAPTGLQNLKWPIVGNWGPSGSQSVGVQDTIAGLYQLDLDLQPGSPLEVTNLDPYVITDSPLLWSTRAPSRASFLMLEALPSQSDLGYLCNGTVAVGTPSQDQNVCPENFLSTLYAWKYDDDDDRWEYTKVQDDPVWAGVATPLAYLTVKNVELVAYYDAQRRVKVAQRAGGGAWTYKTLDSVFGGWDGHNELVLYVDENLDIHLSGNHHSVPLNYWRSNGLDIGTLTARTIGNLGAAGTSLTYPRFFRNSQGQLLFGYRLGSSGNGAWGYYRYDAANRTWVSHLASLFDDY